MITTVIPSPEEFSEILRRGLCFLQPVRDGWGLHNFTFILKESLARGPRYLSYSGCSHFPLDSAPGWQGQSFSCSLLYPGVWHSAWCLVGVE